MILLYSIREKRKLERLEQEVVILKKDIKKLKKKVHKLENKHASENQSDGGELQLSGLNFKKNNLKNAVKGMFNAQQALILCIKRTFVIGGDPKFLNIWGKKL